MLRLSNVSLAYVEKRGDEYLLSKRHSTIVMSTLTSNTYKSLVVAYRQLHIPLLMWDNTIKTISLFTEIAKSSIAIKDSDVIDDILPRLKIELLELHNEITGVTEARSRWGVNPHINFSVSGVQPGIHPTQPTLPEYATDLLLTCRNDLALPHNLIWCVGRYMYNSKKNGNNYILKDANTHIGSNNEALMLSYLDLSVMDCAAPSTLSDKYIIDGENVIIHYPEGRYNGIMLVIAGKLVLDIKDSPDLLLVDGKYRIPLSKFNLTVGHLVTWFKDFNIDDISYKSIFDHETSFIIPYVNDVSCEYKQIRNITRNPHLLSLAAVRYEGDFIIDTDDRMVPYLTEKLPNTDIDNEYIIESYMVNNRNEYTTTDFQLNNGALVDVVTAISKLGLSVGGWFPNTSNFRSVSLSSFKGIKYKE